MTDEMTLAEIDERVEGIRPDAEAKAEPLALERRRDRLDVFAAAALSGLLANPFNRESGEYYTAAAWAQAEAMLEYESRVLSPQTHLSSSL